MKNIVMFPGQGSQSMNMGEGLFEPFKDEIEKASVILGYEVEDFFLNDSNKEKLNQTEYTQPLLFLVNHLFLKTYEKQGIPVDIFIGHSLGEYNALVAAGAFNFLDGLKMVRERGRLMSEVKGGGMVAVLGLEDGVVENLLGNEKTVEVANYNANGQVVISGDLEKLKSLEENFKMAGARRYVFLPVSGAFHSSHLKDLSDEFGKFLDSFELTPPTKTVYANLTGAPYPRVSHENYVKEYLQKQIYSSVRWKQTILSIRKDFPENDFIEVGPGNILKGLVKRI